ncbi:hypothetical protein M404DRAFT_17732 [Pisolithus tinctorius Marx 270]|uniref:Uncharacterized protein n=1 Tax=Pisolithus tinctorius Marx 270 TaxID=870435 RepID=A0A0C3PYU0_PISTI|nr:hypothetical protein M404DRAFT_17732 [Pisolithus tinctorius Marx 270]
MSTHQASPHIPTNSSGFQKATMPELQITSDNEEANIWAKMAKHKGCKALREEAAWLEAERLEREEQVEAKKQEWEWLEAKRQEQECLEAKRKEQEQLEAECQEWETQVQQKTGELKGKEWEKAVGVASTRSCQQCKKGQVSCTFGCTQQSKCKKRTCDWCTKMKVRCELPKGVEPKAEEAGAKAGKKRVLEDVTSPRAGEKKKVT